MDESSFVDPHVARAQPSAADSKVNMNATFLAIDVDDVDPCRANPQPQPGESSCQDDRVMLISPANDAEDRAFALELNAKENGNRTRGAPRASRTDSDLAIARSLQAEEHRPRSRRNTDAEGCVIVNPHPRESDADVAAKLQAEEDRLGAVSAGRLLSGDHTQDITGGFQAAPNSAIGKLRQRSASQDVSDPYKKGYTNNRTPGPEFPKAENHSVRDFFAAPASKKHTVGCDMCVYYCGVDELFVCSVQRQQQQPLACVSVSL